MGKQLLASTGLRTVLMLSHASAVAAVEAGGVRSRLRAPSCRPNPDAHADPYTDSSPDYLQRQRAISTQPSISS